MTNCVGIHCARLLVKIGVDRAFAAHMLIDELQITRDEANAAVEAAYDLVSAGPTP